MNFNGSEVQDAQGNAYLLEQIKDNVDIGSIIGSIQLPNIGGLNNIFGGLLPQNLTQVAEDGVATLLNGVNLEQAIAQGVESVKGLVEQEIKSAMDTAMGVVNEVTDVAEEAISSINTIGTGLFSLNLESMQKGLDSLINVTGSFGVDTSAITSITQSYGSVIDSIQNLSPKALQDLQDPAFYQSFLEGAVGEASALIGNSALAGAVQSIAPSVDISSMINLAQAGVGLFSSGTPTGVGGRENEILVELTTYHGKGDGADFDAAQKKTTFGPQLQSGKSCAVDNSTILFGSTVEIPGFGSFKAVDKAKTSSTSGNPVVAMYFETQEEAVAKELQIIKSRKKTIVVKVKPTGGSFEPKPLQTRGTEYNLF
jgi:3D (Asp-Asp-Asp) domain-containing protein